MGQTDKSLRKTDASFSADVRTSVIVRTHPSNLGALHAVSREVANPALLTVVHAQRSWLASF